jgi:hypothetical protein
VTISYITLILSVMDNSFQPDMLEYLRLRTEFHKLNLELREKICRFQEENNEAMKRLEEMREIEPAGSSRLRRQRLYWSH